MIQMLDQEPASDIVVEFIVALAEETPSASSRFMIDKIGRRFPQLTAGEIISALDRAAKLTIARHAADSPAGASTIEARWNELLAQSSNPPTEGAELLFVTGAMTALAAIMRDADPTVELDYCLKRILLLKPHARQ